MQRDNVVIVGLPGVGKTTFLNKARERGEYKGYSEYHTDDFIEYGFEQSLYRMIDKMIMDKNPNKVIEGVQGFRFLRKVMEVKAQPIIELRPFKVIMLVCDPEIRLQRYKQRNGGKSPNRAFDALLKKVWDDYLTYLSADDVNKLIHTVDVSA